MFSLLLILSMNQFWFFYGTIWRRSFVNKMLMNSIYVNLVCLSLYLCAFLSMHRIKMQTIKTSLSRSYFNRCCLLNEKSYGLVYGKKRVNINPLQITNTKRSTHKLCGQMLCVYNCVSNLCQRCFINVYLCALRRPKNGTQHNWSGEKHRFEYAVIRYRAVLSRDHTLTTTMLVYF